MPSKILIPGYKQRVIVLQIFFVMDQHAANIASTTTQTAENSKRKPLVNIASKLIPELPWWLSFACAAGLVSVLIRKDCSLIRTIPYSIGDTFGVAFDAVNHPKVIDTTHFVRCAIVTSVFFLMIRIIHSLCCRSFKRQYYALHVIVNSIVTLETFWNSISALENPLTSTAPLSGEAKSQIYMCWIFAIHVYHPIFFKTGTMDWIHHVPVYILNLLMFGCLSSTIFHLQSIIMTGIPGGLDYLFLVMEGEKVMKRSTYKDYSAMINNWLRGPLGIMSGYICLVGLWVSRDQIGTETLTTYQAWVFFLMGVHALYNPPYFGRQAIEANIVDTINRYEMKGSPDGTGIKLTAVREKSGKNPPTKTS